MLQNTALLLFSAAGFTKQFLDRMSGPLVQQHCQHYEHGSTMCPDPETVHSSPQYTDSPRASSAHVTTSRVSSALLFPLLLPLILKS